MYVIKLFIFIQCFLFLLLTTADAADTLDVDSTSASKPFEIHIFNTGQADSQLIVFPSGYR